MRLSTVVLITFSLKSSIMTIISVYAQTYAPTTGLIVLIGDQHFPLDPSVRYPGKKVGLTSVYLYFPFLFYTISDSEINFYVDLKQNVIDMQKSIEKLFIWSYFLVLDGGGVNCKQTSNGGVEKQV